MIAATTPTAFSGDPVLGRAGNGAGTQGVV
jgi:hypothetical protein